MKLQYPKLAVMLAARGLSHRSTRRLKRLADAVDAFQQAGFATQLRVEGADAKGDAVARLAAQVQMMSERIAGQIAALERAAGQRRELLANLSHDLRTPLAAMQGYLDLLLLRHGNLEGAEARNALETATRHSERLARLVGDLFHLTELEADDMQLKTEDFTLAELAHDLVHKFASDASRRQVQLSADADVSVAEPAALRVRADIGLIERVIENLVENALRHTPAGGAVKIDIGRDAERARVSVRDTGVGIAADALPGVFERYYRAERVAGNGVTAYGGLGLAIAQRIVRLHGGELRVDSAPGRGTDVSFDLPLADGAAPASPAPNRVAPLVERGESAREFAEAELRATEERYLLALRGSQDGLWEWDLASDAVHLSPRWKSMLGFDSHEIAEDKAAWWARVHPDDRAAMEQALQRHIDGADARFDHEMRLLHKDGSVRNVLSRGVAIRRESGAPDRRVGIDTDVTRLKRVQTVLDAVVEGTAGAVGDGFFPALVRNFARALDVDRAFITECCDHPPTRVRTLGHWRADKPSAGNFEFALAGTPCEAVVNEARLYFHREGVGQMFPRDAAYESYLGMPIIASDGRMLGHLAFFDRKKRGDEMLVESIYKVFVARAAAEIERLQALARLKDALNG